MKAKVVELFPKSGGIISTTKQVSPPIDPESTLKLTQVEVVEMSEVFSKCI
jgi:hypothetical protein